MKAFDLMKDAQERLMAEHPYWGVLSLLLEFIEDPSVKTAVTNGTWLKFNPDYIINRTEKKRMKTIAHETAHPALLHNWRVAGMDLEVANIAADYVVNKALFEDGLADADEFQVVPEYEGLDLEGIYSLIMKQRREEQPQGGGGDDDGEPQPGDFQDDEPQDEPGDEPEDQPGDESDEGEEDSDQTSEGNPDGDPSDQATDQAGSESDQAGDQGNEVPDLGPDKSVFVPGETGKEGEEGPEPEKDWMIQAQVASMVARKAGTMSAEAERLMIASREPQEDWFSICKAFVVHNITKDRSWLHPDRRYYAQGMILPGPTRENTPGFAFGVDTSGSIDVNLLNCFGERMNFVKGEVRPEWVKVAYCDTAIGRVDEFDMEEDLEFHARGGGGTAFMPVFDYFNEQDEQPACLFYFTDLESYDLAQLEEPDYPVMWVVPAYAANTPVPFGEKVVITCS